MFRRACSILVEGAQISQIRRRNETKTKRKRLHLWWKDWGQRKCGDAKFGDNILWFLYTHVSHSGSGKNLARMSICLSSSWVWLLLPWIRCTVEQNTMILNNVLGLNVNYNIARTSEFQELIFKFFFLDKSSFSLRTNSSTEWPQHVFKSFSLMVIWLN